MRTLPDHAMHKDVHRKRGHPRRQRCEAIRLEPVIAISMSLILDMALREMRSAPATTGRLVDQGVGIEVSSLLRRCMLEDRQLHWQKRLG